MLWLDSNAALQSKNKMRYSQWGVQDTTKGTYLSQGFTKHHAWVEGVAITVQIQKSFW